MVTTKLSDCVVLGVCKCLFDGLVSLYITSAYVGKAVHIATGPKDRNHHQKMLSSSYVTVGKEGVPHNCFKAILTISTCLVMFSMFALSSLGTVSQEPVSP